MFYKQGNQAQKGFFCVCVRVHDGLVSSPRPDPRCAEGVGAQLNSSLWGGWRRRGQRAG